MGSVSIHHADLVEPMDIKRVIAEILLQFGPCELLVYNAARWNEVEPMAIDVLEFQRDLSLKI